MFGPFRSPLNHYTRTVARAPQLGRIEQIKAGPAIGRESRAEVMNSNVISIIPIVSPPEKRSVAEGLVPSPDLHRGEPPKQFKAHSWPFFCPDLPYRL